MKFKPKHALAALALAVVAGPASAQVISNLPDTGNSSFYFVALDEVAGRSYFSEMVANAGSTTTGALRLDDLVNNPTGSWTITLSGLSGFASVSTAGNLFGGFGAADTNASVGGGATPALGNRRAIVSIAADSAQPYINNPQIAGSTGFGASYQAFANQISGTADVQCTSSPCIATTPSDNRYAGIGNVFGIGLSWGNPAAPSIGTDLSVTSVAWDIYLAATNGTSAIGSANVTLLAMRAVLDLASNTLTIGNASAPVPVPAAVWLLGSAMLGMFGIGRRKKAGQSDNGLVAA